MLCHVFEVGKRQCLFLSHVVNPFPD
jgi:hypothetical protein